MAAARATLVEFVSGSSSAGRYQIWHSPAPKALRQPETLTLATAAAHVFSVNRPFYHTPWPMLIHEIASVHRGL
jgi:hypothetical protein